MTSKVLLVKTIGWHIAATVSYILAGIITPAQGAGFETRLPAIMEEKGIIVTESAYISNTRLRHSIVQKDKARWVIGIAVRMPQLQRKHRAVRSLCSSAVLRALAAKRLTTLVNINKKRSLELMFKGSAITGRIENLEIMYNEYENNWLYGVCTVRQDDISTAVYGETKTDADARFALTTAIELLRYGERQSATDLLRYAQNSDKTRASAKALLFTLQWTPSADALFGAALLSKINNIPVAVFTGYYFQALEQWGLSADAFARCVVPGETYEECSAQLAEAQVREQEVDRTHALRLFDNN